MATTRAAVVGAGMMGTLHARAISENPASTLVTVVDVDEKRGRDLADKYGAMYTGHYQHVLDDRSIDLVVICLPDQLHRDATLQAIKASKHILLEKPLATSMDDGVAILEASKGYSKKMTVGHLLRYDHRFAQAKKMIADGQIGDIIHMSTWRNNTLSGAERLQGRTSILFYLGVHDIDMLRWFTGCEITKVYADSHSGVLKHLNTEDVFLSLLRFSSGAIASMELSWCLPNGMPARLEAGMEIVGTKGSICIDSFNTGLTLANQSRNFHVDTFHWPEVNERLHGAAADQMAHFLNCITAGTQPLVSVEDAYKAMEVVCHLTESCKRGTPVHI
jgi:predicted dehydrogenase